jgi:predicted nucleic acid-binding protein
MYKAFVDTAAWIALINVSDDLHVPARQVMSTLRQQKVRLVTTEFALLEVADALSAPSTRSQTTAFVDDLWRLAILRIIPASHELFADGWELYKQRPDKDWSLTDCTSFVVMARERIVQAFTSDHHFEQAGFVKLLSSE